MSDLCPPEPDFAANSLEEVLPIFEYSRSYFRDETVRASAQTTVRQTLEWLQANKQSFSYEGHRNARDPWWPTLSFTDDPILIEERGRALRARAFEHGLQDYLDRLADAHVISQPCEATTRVVTSPMTSIIFRELVKGHRAGPPHDKVSMRYMSVLFEYAPESPVAKARNKLAKLAPFGLVEVRHDGTEYEIGVGPIALLFYEQAYFPIIQTMQKNLEGEVNDNEA